MKFLIDGHRDRVSARAAQWPEGVLGQLLTPLTRYRLGHPVFAIDNGAFSGFDERQFRNLLRRQSKNQESALFVAMPDKVGCHRTTLELWEQHSALAAGWRKAFVAQDGFEGAPDNADAIFLGGTTSFKDSDFAAEIVATYLRKGLHVHIGRVNGPERFLKFHKIGAHTCDGSGVSKYDHMILAIKDALK
jgi:hypothetical protein